MKRNIIVAIVLLAAVACYFGFGQKGASQAAKPLMAPRIHFEYAVYLPGASADAIGATRRLIAGTCPGLKETEAPDGSAPSFSVRLETAVKERYAVPDERALQHCGHGLAKGDAERLQRCPAAIIVRFEHGGDEVWAALRNANVIMGKLGRQTSGFIWDEETREVFTADAWETARLFEQDVIPEVASQITIHAYMNGEHMRAVTLGMSKLGLPDLVISETAWSRSRPAGNLINLVAQRLAEGQGIGEAGDFDLDLKSIRNREVRERHVQSLEANGTGTAALKLVASQREEGDARNRLLEISFERAQGNDQFARQERTLGDCFGWKDSVVRIEHNTELLEASERAKAKLPALRQAFSAGLQPGEHLMVKAPFKTSAGGNEWMWVEVTRWEGERIGGLLANEPDDCPGLRAGQEVQVAQTEVFDYLRSRADGTSEGNETDKIISRMSGQKAE